jgi:hypothetical protein
MPMCLSEQDSAFIVYIPTATSSRIVGHLWIRNAAPHPEERTPQLCRWGSLESRIF